jgi:molybdopterin molybdotransferase
VHSDVVVICAGSSVGARDETAAAVAAVAGTEIWCHGLAIKPGKPTLLAASNGIPIIGLPGNPRSALVVFRLIGMPLVRRAGGWSADASRRARGGCRDLPSGGRPDVVRSASGVRLSRSSALSAAVGPHRRRFTVIIPGDASTGGRRDPRGIPYR